MRTRIAAPAALLLVLATFGGWEATPVSAVTPLVQLAISQSPTIGAADTTVTYTGTVTPVGGTSHNVMVGMQTVSGPNFSGGECAPACEGFDPTWTFATLSSKVTVRFTTQVGIGRKVTFFLLGGTAGCSGTCPPSVTQVGPTLTTSASWTSSGQVVAGATLHVTVRAGTNAGPVQGILQVELPSGVDAPTNLPEGVSYDPLPHRVEGLVVAANSAAYSFDTVINAPSPSVLSFRTYFMPSNTANGSAQGTLSVPVGPDTTKPTATGPKVSLVSGTAITGGLVPVRLAWTGADAGSGIDHYELGQSTDGHTYTVVDPGLASGATYRYLAASHTYRFLARAVDHAGNVGSWTWGSPFTLTTDSEATAAIKYGGTWSLSSSTLYRGGKARATTIAGRTATRTFVGKSISWVALKGPTRGKAAVYVDGVLSATVDLYASANQAQRLVWSKNWTSSATHKVMIKVLGTSGRPSVNLDALVIIR